MYRFKIIALTHKKCDIDHIGKWHLDDEVRDARLHDFRLHAGVNGLMYLSTCNRVEFLLDTGLPINEQFVLDLFRTVYPSCTEADLNAVLPSVQVFEQERAAEHLFAVASSIDSLVVGEREIITQVRNAFENCRKAGLTSDLLRLVVQKTIECAKRIYTETNISLNPVSVVSLAYRRLKELQVQLDARVVIIGSGVTNSNMAKYLRKHGFTNFVVFNRTLQNGEKLAKELSGKAYPLNELSLYQGGFDVIVTCTGASESIITPDIYASLTRGELGKKIVIDLAVPNDLDERILLNYEVNLIAVNNLQEIAKRNLTERQNELSACKSIIAQVLDELSIELRERKVELAMRDVPKSIKEIKRIALSEVFADEINKLDSESKETLEKVVAYLEKKYISMPMKMAKEIMLGRTAENPVAEFQPSKNGKAQVVVND